MGTITSAICSSFKKELLLGLHNFDVSPGDVFKLALIKQAPDQNYGTATTNYSELGDHSPQDEVGNSGSYVAGGGTLQSNGVSLSGTTAFVDFQDLSFTLATIAADGCLIYNGTRGNRAVSVHDFGGTKTSTAGTFTISFPTADASNAIIRIA